MKGRNNAGRNLYGQGIGIIMLDTNFIRFPGDIGNATTFSFPVRYKIMKGIGGKQVFLDEGKIDPAVLPAAIEAAQELEKEGVRAITTSCGMLVILQEELAYAVNIPVFTSSLIQVPLVHKMLKKGQKIGIVTDYSHCLTEQHLRKAGINESIPIVKAGMEDQNEWVEHIFRGQVVDFGIIKRNVVNVCSRLVSENPDIGALVFEITNLCPFSAAVQESTGLPVFDIVTLTNMVYEAVVRKKLEIQFSHGFI